MLKLNIFGAGTSAGAGGSGASGRTADIIDRPGPAAMDGRGRQPQNRGPDTAGPATPHAAPLESAPLGPQAAVPDQDPSSDLSMSSAMDDFIYLVSHDLRASMRALLEVPSWIREDLESAGMTLPAEVADHIDLLDRHTSRLDTMLCDLLALSRVGRLQTVTDVDLGRGIDQVLDESALPRNWTIERDLQHHGLRMGDKDVLCMMQALLSNAVKHHDLEVGHIQIRTETQGAEFIMTVQDDGPGIPQAHRESVFDVMRTLRPRDQVEGSGIGLALVRKLARVYGGTARILPPEKDEGRGTCVEVRFPAMGGIVARQTDNAGMR